MSTGKLNGRVSLVTGASRGIGRGIALQLGEAGSLVYLTGRSKSELDATVKEIEKRGGEAIAIVVDHNQDEEVKKLFERIDREQNGKLDILVNNAYAGVSMIMEAKDAKFWDLEPERTWDCINGVGLRNHYICTVLASRLMVPRKSGLIVNVSSVGGIMYLFNVAYGVGKAACDRMAADCAVELKKHNVTMVSLWPGPVKTEMIQKHVLDNPDASEFKSAFMDAESVEFAGKAVVNLAADPHVHRKTGKIQMTSDCAREYGFVDSDGLIHGDMRCIKIHLQAAGWNTLASFTPAFIRVPYFMLHFLGYKF